MCSLYSQINKKIPEVYDESKKVAEQKIKERQIELDELELEEVKSEEDIDLTIDEFEEEDEEIPLKFEKRKVGKEDLDTDEFGEIECPFCGEIFENLESHMQSCELAPDDASPDDFLPKRRKKKKPKSSDSETEESKGKEKCPYCGKEFVRLGRHLKSCSKRPKDEDEDDEEDDEDDEE